MLMISFVSKIMSMNSVPLFFHTISLAKSTEVSERTLKKN